MDNVDKHTKATDEMLRLRHRMIHDITFRLENFSLNTVVSGFMEYNNKMIEMNKAGGIDRETLETAIVLLAPFTPHLSEELWNALGHKESVFKNTWPVHDAKMMEDTEKEVAVQINGKTKMVIKVAADISKENAIKAGIEALSDKLTGDIVKEIYVPGRIINIVAKQ